MPKPRELEIAVVAYAPHFVGFAAAVAASSSSEAVVKAGAAISNGIGQQAAPQSVARSSSFISALGVAGWGAGGAKAQVKEESSMRREPAGFVPTGLSPDAVWPDEELEKKQKEMSLDAGFPDKVRRRLLLRVGEVRRISNIRFTCILEVIIEGCSLPAPRNPGSKEGICDTLLACFSAGMPPRLSNWLRLPRVIL